MGKSVFKLLAILLLGAVPALPAMAAQETGHYINGVEGIKGATLPPPGLYYRMYNTYYTADTITDADGDEIDIGFDADVFANVHRFIWVSEYKLLGADYGADLFIPLVYSDIDIDALGIHSNEFGLGDIIVEPLILGWHGKWYDAVFGLGFYLPTGDYDNTNPASPGKGFWTTMFTAGATVYADPAKTWSFSLLARYEIHAEKDDDDITPGDDFHFEWGIGKTLAGEWIWDLGIAGYCQWQVSDDSGDDVLWDKSDHDRVYGIGPHVSLFIPRAGFVASLMTQWEFEARDRPEGQVTTLSLIKFF